MGQTDLLDKYPDFLNTVREINDSEDMYVIVIEKNEFQKTFDGEIRLFGLYENEKLRKMSLISIENRRLDAVDYYLSGDKLFYVTESSDLMGEKGMAIEKENSYSRYIFLDNQICDYERVGKDKNTFDKLASEKRIIKDSIRNIGLLKNKRTEKRNIE